MKNNDDKLAGFLYDTYCEAVGGKAFNGDPLPTWEQFRADPAKQKQSAAWVAVANRVAGTEAVVQLRLVLLDAGVSDGWLLHETDLKSRIKATHDKLAASLGMRLWQEIESECDRSRAAVA